MDINNTLDWKTAQATANQLLFFKETKGSGNVHGDGDGINSRFIHEVKFRNTEALSVPKKQWDKFKVEANNHGKIPIFTMVRANAADWEYITFANTKDLNTLITTNFRLQNLYENVMLILETNNEKILTKNIIGKINKLFLDNI